ncbi:MAG TPA: hypothetical protein VFW76_05555 [Ktedonobacterales bacterium]|nr:hypothetical protein [Ktedonobacterales bacterium]
MLQPGECQDQQPGYGERDDFERRTSGSPYRSPLDPEMERPLELPEWVLEAVGD